MFIDGEWCDALSGATVEATSPATGESLGPVAEGDREDAQRAIDAAAASVSAAAAPVVTSPASAPVAWAMRALAASCSSPISTEARDAAAIASTTSGAMTAPPRRVSAPAALMRRQTPNCA